MFSEKFCVSKFILVQELPKSEFWESERMAGVEFKIHTEARRLVEMELAISFILTSYKLNLMAAKFTKPIFALYLKFTKPLPETQQL
jgi:hypothetical protein